MSDPVAGQWTGRTYVAVCDILGFGGLVQRQPLPYLQGLVELVLSAVGRVVPRGSVETALVSDTIILWAPEPSKDIAVFSVAMAMGNLFRDFLEEECLPVRGALVYGDLHVDRTRNLLVGAAIVDGYRLEQTQDWMGAVVAPSLVPSLDQTPATAPEWARELFIRYPAPLRDGVRVEQLCLNWIRDYERCPEFLEMGFFPLGVDKATHSVYRKYRNTLEFCSYCKAQSQREST